MNREYKRIIRIERNNRRRRLSKNTTKSVSVHKIRENRHKKQYWSNYISRCNETELLRVATFAVSILEMECDLRNDTQLKQENFFNIKNIAVYKYWREYERVFNTKKRRYGDLFSVLSFVSVKDRFDLYSSLYIRPVYYDRFFRDFDGIPTSLNRNATVFMEDGAGRGSEQSYDVAGSLDIEKVFFFIKCIKKCKVLRKSYDI